MNYVDRLGQNTYTNCIQGVKTVAVSGHIRPDGDCVGACLGLSAWLLDRYPELTVDVYLDPIPEEFLFLKHADKIRQENEDDVVYDLCIALDCSDPDRLNRASRIFEEAARTVCIDHHITNQGFGDRSVVCPESSSTCELLYYLFEDGRLFGSGEFSYDCAQALYLGIVHDTGVFKHNNTTLETMTAAGKLMGFGLNTEKIINDTFFRKTYLQNQLLGKALTESILMLDGRMIFSALYQKDFRLLGASEKDTDGIIDQLRVTEGIHVALFLYETREGDFKVSLRSDEAVDVSQIAAEFGGGGHVRAAGCTMTGNMHDIVTNIATRAEMQLIDYQQARDLYPEPTQDI